MITLELAESREGRLAAVEVDFCTECGGIWLDKGELEMLLGGSEQAKQLLNSFSVRSPADKVDSKSRKGRLAACAEKPRKCPICLKKAQKIIVGTSEPPLLIDKCRKDHGLWFDRGELEDVLARANLDKESKIQRLLAEIFPACIDDPSRRPVSAKRGEDGSVAKTEAKRRRM
jgi:Zn-finger nucleic acid-binding protein